MILKNSFIIAFFSVISLVLGVVRDRLLAQVVGVGPMLDVYNAAFRIPDLVYGILLSAVSAATVVPFITKHKDEDVDELQSKFNSLFFFFGGALSISSVIAMFLTPSLTPHIVPGFDEFQRGYFIIATRILLIQPLFLGLSALIASLAQVRHRFVLYGVAPLFYTGAIIASIPLLYPTHGIYGIVAGVVVGAFGSLVIQSYTLYESRMNIKLSLFSWKHVRTHMRIALPRSLANVLSRIREIIFTAVATSLGVGVLSTYLFAQRITDAFVQVVVQSAATAALPILSHKHVHNEQGDFARLLRINLISIVGISVIVSALIIIYAETIVRVIYGNVANAHQIAVMARGIAWMLPVYAVNIYFANAFNAAKDTAGLLYANIISSSLSVLVLYLLAASYGSFALIIGGWTLSGVYLASLLIFYTRKKR
ncbi:MAG: hypothetical protein RIQ41_535 [Candidatus Parcubacteria bacterium]|jgi:putative peptidoglycan lipid II flippase